MNSTTLRDVKPLMSPRILMPSPGLDGIRNCHPKHFARFGLHRHFPARYENPGSLAGRVRGGLGCGGFSGILNFDRPHNELVRLRLCVFQFQREGGPVRSRPLVVAAWPSLLNAIGLAEVKPRGDGTRRLQPGRELSGQGWKVRARNRLLTLLRYLGTGFDS